MKTGLLRLSLCVAVATVAIYAVASTADEHESKSGREMLSEGAGKNEGRIRRLEYNNQNAVNSTRGDINNLLATLHDWHTPQLMESRFRISRRIRSRLI